MSIPLQFTTRMVGALADQDGKAALSVCHDLIVFLVSGEGADDASDAQAAPPTDPKDAAATLAHVLATAASRGGARPVSVLTKTAARNVALREQQSPAVAPKPAPKTPKRSAVDDLTPHQRAQAETLGITPEQFAANAEHARQPARTFETVHGSVTLTNSELATCKETGADPKVFAENKAFLAYGAKRKGR